VEALIQSVLNAGARQALPGEFTARAYLNGKLDLNAAEAVNEVISCTNRIQCEAAQRMLRGRLSASVEAIRAQILGALSLIEGALDFADEDIPANAAKEGLEALRQTRQQLEDLLSQAVQTDALAHHPSVGIGGLSNAGKSSLFNALVGSERSLVSDRQRTTRDVLEAVWDLPHGRCVLFDCAGLLPKADEVLDRLAQQAAIQSLSRSELVLFCVDVAACDWQEDLAILGLIGSRSLLCAATKADLLSPADLETRLDLLARTFNQSFLPVSSHTGMNLRILRDRIDTQLLSGPSLRSAPDCGQVHTMLTARLRQSGRSAIEHLREAIEAMGQGQEEVAAMMVRAAYETLGEAERPVDERVLDTIFSRFCIGK
jgi:tRNA modification GTPase